MATQFPPNSSNISNTPAYQALDGSNKKKGNLGANSVDRSPSSIDHFSGNKIEKFIFNALSSIKNFFSRVGEPKAKPTNHTWTDKPTANTANTAQTTNEIRKRIYGGDRPEKSGVYDHIGEGANTEVKSLQSPARSISDNEKSLRGLLENVDRNEAEALVKENPERHIFRNSSLKELPEGMQAAYAFTRMEGKNPQHYVIYVNKGGEFETKIGDQIKLVGSFEKLMVLLGEKPSASAVKNAAEPKYDYSNSRSVKPKYDTSKGEDLYDVMGKEVSSKTFIQFRSTSEYEPKTQIGEMLRSQKEGTPMEVKPPSEESVGAQIIKKRKELKSQSGDGKAPGSKETAIGGETIIQSKPKTILDKKIMASERQLKDLLEPKYSARSAKEELSTREVGDFIVHPARLREPLPKDVRQAFYISIKEENGVGHYLFYLTKRGQFRDKSGKNVYDTFGANREVGDLYSALVKIGKIRDFT